MYAEVIKRTDEQAIRPAAVACRVIYDDMISKANEQSCVGKYFVCATPEQPHSVQIYFQKTYER